MTRLCRIDRAIALLEEFAIHVAAAVLFAIMIIVVIDVALRYLFRSPLSWSYDLISLYLMAAVFLLSLSHTLREGKHINVNLFSRYFSDRVRLAVAALGGIAVLVVFAMVFKEGALRTWQAGRANDVLGGAIAWPTWAAQILIPLGFGLIVLRLSFRVLVGLIGTFGPTRGLAGLAGAHHDDGDPEERV